jgi:hypothetical protein
MKLYVIEKMDFERVKAKIDPAYLSSLEFLESLEVASSLLNEGEAPLAFKYGELMQNWSLQVMNNNSCDFSIICSKNEQKIDIECLASHNNIRQLGLKNEHELIHYFNSKYGTDINVDNSNIQDDPIGFKFFCYFDFNKLPTIEQISSIYHDLFLEKKGVKRDDKPEYFYWNA